MELVNLATLPDADDFEIAPGIFFKKSDDWRIQYNQSEHELFNFSYNIDQGVSINRFPALKTLHKNLTYSFMPHLLNDRIKSYKTTKCSGRLNPNTILSGSITLNNEVFNEKTKTIIQSGI